MKLTYYGHSCFSIEINGKILLFDPYITPNQLAKDIDIIDIEADYVFISHAHEDHTADAEMILRNTGATLISNWEIIKYYKKKGIEETHAMNIGGKFNFDFGLVKMVEAVHSSSFTDGTYGGTAAGFVIDTGDKCFYYSGDTSLNLNMRLIGDFFNIDFALLPIGDNFTMGFTEAIIASDYVQTDKIIGLHYDTFSNIEINKEEAMLLAEGSQKELLLLKIGKSIIL